MTPAATDQLEMWRDWKSSNEDPDKLQPLLTALNPVIRQNVNKYSAPRIYKPAIEGHARMLTVSALKRYDPAKKANISTFVNSNLMSLNRYVKQNQNFSRIVENRAAIIGPVQKAVDQLKEELGREPTTNEIADRTKMSPKEIDRLSGELRADIFTLPNVEFGDSSPFQEFSPVEKEILEMLPYELTFDENRVFDILFGRNGQRKETKGNAIAKRLNWSPAKVSGIKKKIMKKYREYEGAL